VEFLERGDSNDVEALYELSKLADTDAAAAETVIADHALGGCLRDQVKAAARAARPEGRDDDASDGPPPESTERSAGPELSEESFRLDERTSSASDDEEEENDDDQAAEADKKPSWLPSDAPELDERFDANPAVTVTAVEARRAGHLVFTTSRGEVTYELAPEARDQLQALLR
jgi:hypothetical protein